MADPPFDPRGRGYDYKSAREAGLSAQPVPYDDVPHWPSREPYSGLILKGREHPTFEEGVEADRREGYGLEMHNGRYYTKPFDPKQELELMDAIRSYLSRGR